MTPPTWSTCCAWGVSEAYIAPPELRELRELVRHRAKLVAVRSGLKAQVHAILAKEGVPVTVTDLFGVAGRSLLATVPLADAYRQRIDSLLGLIAGFDTEIVDFAEIIDDTIAGERGYEAIRTIWGVGPVLAAIFVAEIGDITRFGGPAQLCSWAGLTPRHRESDTHVRRGHITKQGSRLVRWAAVEAVGRHAAPPPSLSTTAGSPSGEADRSAGSRRHANFSPSSTTACATERSAAWPRRDETRQAQPARELVFCHDPRPGGVVARLIEPVLAAAAPLHATTRVADR